MHATAHADHRGRHRRWQAVALAAMAIVGLQASVIRAEERPDRRAPGLDTLAVAVTAEQNRAVSFTNKRSAFYYTQTHRNDHPEHAHFRGLNIAGRRVFNDYRVVVGGEALQPGSARATVFPDSLQRTYPNGVIETLRLFDDQDVVEIAVDGATGAVRFDLSGDHVTADGTRDGVDDYVSRDPAGNGLADYLAVARGGSSFLVAAGDTRESARALAATAVRDAAAWRTRRHARMESVIGADHFVWTDDPRLTASLRWLQLTTDSLVTRQRGDGIFAGLPWFNEYWGRDSFIALPGATLATGRFEEARAILASFAQFQDLDRGSRFYGRLPNIVKPGSIDYHTTDGTPRWVIALRDYLRYSGDRALVRELYPNVTASIEGALAHWTDAAGYLVHADNETWMDARREPDKVAYVPRGTRANDIQALWYAQLRAGAAFARLLDDTAAAERWSRAADRLREAFARDFVDAATASIADHLDARDVPNRQLRPNALFALPLVADEAVAARATRRAWEDLVYPWGVATLDQRDPGFHPFHLAPGYYHKDAAYHNGTVWPWLNGIAMQRMLEFGRTDLAWTLFRATGEIALTRGMVGGLPENLDAYPHPGEAVPRLTGTYLQAWSNAEHLRTWYQGFLGLQPDLERDEIRLAPRLPAGFGATEFTVRVGVGRLHGRYDIEHGRRRYAWQVEGQPVTLVLDVAPYEVGSLRAEPGDRLRVRTVRQGLQVQRLSAQGETREVRTLAVSAARAERQARLDAILSGTRFAAPGDAAAHPVMQQVRKP